MPTLSMLERLQRDLVRHGLFPLQERLKHHTTLADLRTLNASQWWPAGQLAAYRQAALTELLTEIAAHVPYYRELFARLGLDPADLRVDSLSDLPLLDKATIRANAEGLRSPRHPDMQRSNTGGSTGAPLKFWLTRERVSHDVAAKLRSFEWWDVTFGDRELVVWGAPHELGRQDRIRNLRDRLFRSALMPAFNMGDVQLQAYCETIRRKRPRILFGYPSAITLIAEHAARHQIDLSQIGVSVVFVTAEQLYPHQRNAITEAFGCPVANGYGARDAGFIAHECPHGNLHITAEDIIVEIVDESGVPVAPGETGEIVTTHLRNRGYPLIRYRTGDLGHLDPNPCPCGRTLPVLGAVEGRSTDFLLAADGRRVHALGLIYVLRDRKEVREFQIHQPTTDRIEVRIDCGPDSARLAPRLGAEITAQFQKILGNIAVDIEWLSPLPRPKSGKFRYVTSDPGQAHA